MGFQLCDLFTTGYSSNMLAYALLATGSLGAVPADKVVQLPGFNTTSFDVYSGKSGWARCSAPANCKCAFRNAYYRGLLHAACGGASRLPPRPGAFPPELFLQFEHPLPVPHLDERPQGRSHCHLVRECEREPARPHQWPSARPTHPGPTPNTLSHHPDRPAGSPVPPVHPCPPVWTSSAPL